MLDVWACRRGDRLRVTQPNRCLGGGDMLSDYFIRHDDVDAKELLRRARFMAKAGRRPDPSSPSGPVRFP